VIRSLLIGIIAGMRSLTPLAAVSMAARGNTLAADTGAPPLLSSRAFSNAAVALAAGELLGDKMRSAPDRIIVPGMIARVLTGAVAGMALAPRKDRHMAAVLGAAGAIGSAHLSFGLRMRAMQRFGQTPTGIIEDAAAVAGALWLARTASKH
jgi:uncharacterized membrane protein